MTVVVLPDPSTGEPKYFTLPGRTFGLRAASAKSLTRVHSAANASTTATRLRCTPHFQAAALLCLEVPARILAS